MIDTMPKDGACQIRTHAFVRRGGSPHKQPMGLGIILLFSRVERVVVALNLPSEIYERGSGDQSRSPALRAIMFENLVQSFFEAVPYFGFD